MSSRGRKRGGKGRIFGNDLLQIEEVEEENQEDWEEYWKEFNKRFGGHK